ncbi:MAG: sodium:solute symporter family protein [Planctomycetota bacterium]
MSTQMIWTIVFVGVTFSIYLGIAWLSRVKDTKGFFIAGGGVPAPANGMATAADWMSAASFISMAGLISGMGFAGGVYLMGWTGGYVLLALLLAPYLRKFGHFTVPDFVGDRYESSTARIIALLCAIFISFTYVVGQMKGVGVVFSGFLGVTPAVGVFIGMAIVFCYAVFGGMKGITWTQVAQFWVLITAFLIPAIAISLKLTGSALPPIGLGSQVLESVDPARPYLLDKLTNLNEKFGFASYTEAYGENAGKWNKLNVFCVCFALMAGTAGLPHVIVRFYTVKTVKAARWSAFWALLFISMLYLTAPSVAAFARYYMVDDIAGLNGARGVVQIDTVDGLTLESIKADLANGKSSYQQADGQRTLFAYLDQDQQPRLSEIAPWYFNWNKTGLIAWVDFNGDGRVAFTNNLSDEPITGDDGQTILPNELMRVSGVPGEIRDDIIADADAWLQKYGGAENNGSVAKAELIKLGAAHHPDRDIIVLATPQMAQLADWVVAFVIAGGLAAALSTASGLLLVISSSVSHDLYYRVMNPQASEKQRLLVGRVAIGVAVLIAGYFGINPPGFVGEVVAFAFGLAAASFFPAIVLGIFTRRVSTIPAVAGMLVGIGFTAFYIVTQKAEVILLNAEVADSLLGPKGQGLRQPWFFNIDAQGIGTAGMAINFIVTLTLTPLFKPPSDKTQAMIDQVREPEEAGAGVVMEAAVDQ